MCKFFMLLLIFSLSVSAATKSLVLNGSGFREATIFNIKVYKAELFLEEKTKDPQQIINSKQEKRISITFERDVDQEKLVSTWKKSFENTMGKEGFAKISESFNVFKNAITDMKEKDNWTILFHAAGDIEFIDKNQKTHKIQDPLFAKSLLSIWLGENPPNESLKNGLLGIEV